MVEIYELETKLNGQEDIIQYHDLIKELGLSGQSEVIVDESKEPIPYQWMNSQQRSIVSEICPKQVPVDQYDKEPIPIEVLTHLKKCIDNEYFHEYRIAYTDIEPDPFLIGLLGGYYYKDDACTDKKEISSVSDFNNSKELKRTVYGQTWYAIARWGAEKMSWEKLAEKAKIAYIKRESVQAEKDIRDAKRRLEDLEYEAFNRFAI